MRERRTVGWSSRRLWALASLLLGAGRSAAAEGWWNDAWEQRVTVTLSGVPSAFPVAVRGSVLQGAGLTGRVSVDSFRAIGPAGEVPCQVDECDGSGEFVACGNGGLDADDELVFVVPAGAGGPVAVTLYCSRHPRPAGRYASTLRYVRPSGALNGQPVHGVFYDGDLKVGVRGPKSADPLKNELANWCSGAVSALRWKGWEFVRPGDSWTWFLPRHAFGAGPSAVVWSLPELVVDGPVRKTVAMEATGLEAPVERVRHLVSVYAGFPAVDFVETVHYRESQPRLELQYHLPLAVTADAQMAAGAGDGLAPVSLTAEQRAALARGQNVALSQGSALRTPQPWWGWCSPEQGVGLALFFGREVGADGRLLPPAAWSTATSLQGACCQTVLTLRFTGQTEVRHAMRFLCTERLDGVPGQFRAWSLPLAAWATVGKVESREAAR